MDPVYEVYVRMAIVFFGIAVFATFQFFSANSLFAKLASAYPRYYAGIGRPQYNLVSLSQRLSAIRFTAKLLFGVPKDFPEDSKLRLHANVHRAILLVVAVMTIPAAIWMALPLA
jgi:hypothetical protein